MNTREAKKCGGLFPPPKPGQIVSIAGLDIDFAPAKRCSPYDEMLTNLKAAGENAALRLEPSQWASIYARARKAKLTVERAVKGDVLWVRIAAAPPMSDDDRRKARWDAVEKALAFEPMGQMQMAAWIRKNCNLDVDAPVVESILKQMARNGRCELKEGRWRPLKKG